MKILALIAAALLIAPEVVACSCTETPSVAESLLNSKAVFVGEVEKIVLKRRWTKYPEGRETLSGGVVLKDEGLMYEPGVTIVFAVDRSWKGVKGPRIEIATSIDPAACGFDFKLGNRYLVFADQSRRGLSAGLCSRIAHLSDASRDLEVLAAPEHDFFKKKMARIRKQLRTRPVVEDAAP